MVPQEERSLLYVGGLEWWVTTNRVWHWECQHVLYLRITDGNFFEGRKPSLSTVREHLYCVVCADHCVSVLMAFLTGLFPP